jgi:hypothetical protein
VSKLFSAREISIETVLDLLKHLTFFVDLVDGTEDGNKVRGREGID